MAMLAHDPDKARSEGVSQATARDFMRADKGRKFGKRGGRKTKRKSGRE